VLQEIVELFGRTGAPAIAIASTYASFEFVERLASEQAKRALARRLKEFDVTQSAVLPEGTYEIFQRLFGKRQFSLKCLVRSACFSVLGVGILLSAAYFSHYQEFAADAEDVSPFWQLFGVTEFDDPLLVIPGVWALFSLGIDFLNLFKTRMLLRVLKRKSYGPSKLTVILFVDAVIGIAVFFAFFSITELVLVSFEVGSDLSEATELIQSNFQSVLLPIGHVKDALMTYASLGGIESVFFYASMIPSIWLWLFIFSVFATRAIAKGGPLFTWLIWFFDIDHAPFRSVGVVASVVIGAVVGIVSLVAKIISLVVG